MPKSIAVLSDIHGVLPALNAVLAEPDVQNADLIVVTGDHAAGPQPSEVLDRLTGLGDQVLLVRGNADRDIVTLAQGHWPADVEPFPIDAWAAAQLSAAHIELLAALPHPVSADLDGFGSVLFCHGTPRDDEEVVLVDTRLSRWSEAFEGLGEETRVVVCGHTHMPFIRLVDRRWVLNSGSIGMPYGTPAASWALLSQSGLALRRTALDSQTIASEIIQSSTYPNIREWVDEYILAIASDVEAINAFGPRDGRGRTPA